MKQASFRKATLQDINFLIDTILASEKSGTEIIPLCSIFEMDESALQMVLKHILEEETEGCEMSLASFMIAEIDGNKAAAAAGWIEGENEMHLPSSLIKANLLNYFLPKACISAAAKNSVLIADALIDRTAGTFQFEYVYVHPDFRGMGLAAKLIKMHLNSLKKGLKAEVQVFGNNHQAIRSYEKAGFRIEKVCESEHPAASDFLPGTSKILMTKII